MNLKSALQCQVRFRKSKLELDSEASRSDKVPNLCFPIHSLKYCMYVYIYIYIYICAYSHTYTLHHMHTSHTYIYIYIYTHVRACVHITCMHAHMQARMQPTCIHACIAITHAYKVNTYIQAFTYTLHTCMHKCNYGFLAYNACTQTHKCR